MHLTIKSTLQIRKLEKSILVILDLKTDNFEKFTVDGNAFQTLMTRSTKNFCRRLDVHLGLNNLYL